MTTTLGQRCLAIALLWITTSSAAWAEKTAWNPAKTRAVIVGVLAWQDPSIATFASKDRKDQELYDVLVSRGVPAGNITLLLDQKASKQAILQAFSASLEATGPDQTFLFYYAGHGIDGRDGILFVPFDYGSGEGLYMSEISELMTSQLKAQKTLLLADCCFSGGLGDVAKGLVAGGKEVGSLSSATALIPSVSNWTFTQMLIDGLRGESASDRNADQDITLAEIAQEATDAMRFQEQQQAGVSARPWFEDLVMASAPAVNRDMPDPFTRYDYVSIDNGATRELARLVDFQGGKFVVEIQNYSDRSRVEVGPEAIRPLPATPVPAGSAAERQRLASVDGKYSKLLQTVEVEPDYLKYTPFYEEGFNESCYYANGGPFPAGYWVYVYPNWYIWGKETK